jgi:hypothetical protein
MMHHSVKLLLGAGGLIFTTLSIDTFAADCARHWEHPASEHVEMRGMTLSLDEYAHNERHFSIKRADHLLDIYFLQDALLIKGPPLPEIERYSEEELSWFPMAFAIPNTVLSVLSPQGPCSIKNKKQFSRDLPGTLGFGIHKLTHVEGEVKPAGSSKVAYRFAITVSPPLEGQGLIQYSGLIRFAKKTKPLAAATKLTGYALVGVMHPLPLIGGASLRLSTLGQLRAALARQAPADQDDEDDGDERLRF